MKKKNNNILSAISKVSFPVLGLYILIAESLAGFMIEMIADQFIGAKIKYNVLYFLYVISLIAVIVSVAVWAFKYKSLSNEEHIINNKIADIKSVKGRKHKQSLFELNKQKTQITVHIQQTKKELLLLAISIPIILFMVFYGYKKTTFYWHKRITNIISEVIDSDIGFTPSKERNSTGISDLHNRQLSVLMESEEYLETNDWKFVELLNTTSDLCYDPQDSIELLERYTLIPTSNKKDAMYNRFCSERVFYLVRAAVRLNNPELITKYCEQYLNELPVYLQTMKYAEKIHLSTYLAEIYSVYFFYYTNALNTLDKTQYETVRKNYDLMKEYKVQIDTIMEDIYGIVNPDSISDYSFYDFLMYYVELDTIWLAIDSEIQFVSYEQMLMENQKDSSEFIDHLVLELDERYANGFGNLRNCELFDDPYTLSCPAFISYNKLLSTLCFIMGEYDVGVSLLCEYYEELAWRSSDIDSVTYWPISNNTTALLAGFDAVNYSDDMLDYFIEESNSNSFERALFLLKRAQNYLSDNRKSENEKAQVLLSEVETIQNRLENLDMTSSDSIALLNMWKYKVNAQMALNLGDEDNAMDYLAKAHALVSTINGKEHKDSDAKTLNINTVFISSYFYDKLNEDDDSLSPELFLKELSQENTLFSKCLDIFFFSSDYICCVMTDSVRQYIISEINELIDNTCRELIELSDGKIKDILWNEDTNEWEIYIAGYTPENIIYASQMYDEDVLFFYGDLLQALNLTPVNEREFVYHLYDYDTEEE